jgi:hypothetical protein
MTSRTMSSRLLPGGGEPDPYLAGARPTEYRRGVAVSVGANFVGISVRWSRRAALKAVEPEGRASPAEAWAHWKEAARGFKCEDLAHGQPGRQSGHPHRALDSWSTAARRSHRRHLADYVSETQLVERRQARQSSGSFVVRLRSAPVLGHLRRFGGRYRGAILRISIPYSPLKTHRSRGVHDLSPGYRVTSAY